MTKLKKQVKWAHWKSNTFHDLIDEWVIDQEFGNFQEYILKNFPKAKIIGVQLKIQFRPGYVRSLSKLLIVKIIEWDMLPTIFNRIFDEEKLIESNQEVDELYGEVIFLYKVLPDNSKHNIDILSDKNRFLQENIGMKGDYSKKFNIKEVVIPAHMNLLKWPNIKFSDDNNYANSSVKSKSGKLVNILISIKEGIHHVKGYINETLIFKFTDTMMDKNNLSSFKRVIANEFKIVSESKTVEYAKKLLNVYIYNNGKIKYVGEDKKGKFLKVPYDKNTHLHSKIITMDLETRTDYNGIMIPICISTFDGINLKTFTFENNDWREGIKNVLKSFMIRKYYGYNIYFHNFAKFDGVFLVDIISSLGKTEVLSRNNTLIQIKIRFDKDKNQIYRGTLTFKDSLLILPVSLSKLAKSFISDDPGINRKDHFPLGLLNPNVFAWNNNFLGAPPKSAFIDYSGVLKISDKEYEEYSKRFKGRKWIFKNELKLYCEKDVIVLHKILIKFSQLIWGKFEVIIMNHSTLPSICFQIFRSKYLKRHTVPLIFSEMHKDIKSAYYGGYSEMYKPIGRNVHSYDVNSLYPYSMYSFPMPVGLPTKFTGDPYLINNDPFGFFFVKVIAPSNLKVPILPLRYKSANGFRTITPVGTWEGWYFSEEIKNAMKYGYKFEILHGYLFEKEIIFQKYVNELYEMKCNLKSDDPMYLISKLCLNSLYGRFGMNPTDEFTVICSETQSNVIAQKYSVSSLTPMQSGRILLTYTLNPEVEKEMEDTIVNDALDGPLKNISVPIAAAITAYSRVHMSKFMMEHSENLLAIDTDGIKTLKHLKKSEIDNKELGKMKYEGSFSEMVSPAPKVYGGIIEGSNNTIIKIKGLKKKLNYLFLKNVLYKDCPIITNHELWKRSIGESIITIVKQTYKLAITESKRELIFDNFGFLVDTLPFIMVNGKIELRKNKFVLYYLPLPYLPPKDYYLNRVILYKRPNLSIVPFIVYIYPLSITDFIIYIHPLSISPFIIYIHPLSLVPYKKSELNLSIR